MLNNPVDGVMRLKKTIVLTAEAAAITINQDDNGNPLNLKQVKLVTYIPAFISGNIAFRINNISATAYYIGTTIYSRGFLTRSNTLFSGGIIDISVIAGNIFYSSSGENASSSAYNTSTFIGSLYGQSVASINSFYIFSDSAGQNLPVGTTIEVWGVDA